MTTYVTLRSYDPSWAATAQAEGKRLLAGSTALVTVHHIGSTSIDGMAAKPIIDLLGEITNLLAFDQDRPVIEAFGYDWRGEYGLERRRYCTRTDVDGRRLIHLHCYAQGDSAIRRHLVFRDHLRAFPKAAAAYQDEKLRCARLHPTDSGAYTLCKSEWIRRLEQEALGRS